MHSVPERGFSFWQSVDSVQERAFWCTEYAFGAKKGLLVYATRFQRHSVQKTGFSGTEGKFGAKNSLLVYGTHPQRCETTSYCTGHILESAKQPPLGGERT